MSKSRRLSKRQITVIEELFSGETDEQGVLEKHGINSSTFAKWMRDEMFRRAFEERAAAAWRQSRTILAKYAPLAAAKLVELASKGRGETTRKACLDIISVGRDDQKRKGRGIEGGGDSGDADREEVMEFTERTASRLLAVLAEEGPAK